VRTLSASASSIRLVQIVSSQAQNHLAELAEAPLVTFPFATRLGGRLEPVHRVTARDDCTIAMIDLASRSRLDHGRVGPRTAPWSPARRTRITSFFQYSPELLNRVGLELVAGHHLVGSDQAHCRRTGYHFVIFPSARFLDHYLSVWATLRFARSRLTVMAYKM
jgi:hypothetical protein